MRSDGSPRQPDPRLERWLEHAVIGERQPGPVRLVEYDPGWPARFQRVREHLARGLGARAKAVEHIGSTAIPGMVAKPVIDVLVTVDDVEDEDLYLPVIVELGYELRVRERGHRMFRTVAPGTHVHVCAEGGREQRDYLLLRDWLRQSPDDRVAYARLKRQLADQDWPDVNYYAEAKGSVIGRILERAGRATNAS